MRRRLLIAVGASALLIATSLPMTAMAAGPSPKSHRIDVSKIDKAFSPLVDPDKTVTAVLQLSGRSALAAGGSRADQRAHADGLKAAQDAVAKAAAKLGAKVTGTYRYAYNGVRVSTKVGKLVDLAGIKGVVAVRPLRQYTRSNTNGVPAIGAPTSWAGGLTGDGVTVAVIDTGIDYTHANFGGPGTTIAYSGNDPTTIEVGTFPTTKVIDGYDFAGDGYDANGANGSVVPTPDPDPLDCAGHGSHVSGTIAGYGVNADHSTYAGAYGATTLADPSAFAIGPGVAPEANLIGLKVFGCEGSTDLVVDALDWVAEYNANNADAIDVVNMSLGSPFGSNTDVDSAMTNDLVASGVVVVASAGNEASVPYITGSPAAATKAISVAAYDALPTLPMALIDRASTDITGLNQNGFPGLPVTGDLFNVIDGTSAGLGCDVTDYPAGVSGKIAVIQRGVCAFVDKGAAAEAAGAIAVIVVNRDDLPAGALPSYIGYNPDIFNIPMIGVANDYKATLSAATGETVTLSAAGTAASPTYRQIAGFSSSGPRYGDSALKPDVAAPGVSVYSTGVGLGWNGTTMSGTSMAAPMTTGAVALVLEANPSWTPSRVKAALANTASGTLVVGYTPVRSGAGLIQVNKAATSKTFALASDGTSNLSFGYVNPKGAWKGSRSFTITNNSTSSVTYTLKSSSSVVALSVSSVTIAAGKSAKVTATASLSATTVNALCSPDYWSGQTSVCDLATLTARTGVITATPKTARTGVYALRVPFGLFPRPASDITASRYTSWTTSSGKTSGKLVLANTGGHTGEALVFATGVTDVAGDGRDGNDVRAAGVQVQPASWLDPFEDYIGPDDRSLIWAVNMYDKFSSYSPHQAEVQVDTNNDGVADFHVFTVDYGNFTAGAYSGDLMTLVTNANYVIIDSWYADSTVNGSTVLLSAAASDFGLADGSGEFKYRVVSWNGFTGWPDATGWTATAFDAYAPKISQGTYKLLKKGTAAKISAWFYRAANPKGWMVVTMDDRNGAYQADLVALP
jgi:minor extracellular serine protease Vpr